jgi:tetratricopeptide (TPR) repeat protein
MRYTVFAALLGVIAATLPLSAHQDDEIKAEYFRRVAVADTDSSTAEDRYLAAEAARFMRRFDEARHYVNIAQMAALTESDRNDILRERLWLELATGGGVEGLQSLFDDEIGRRAFPPTVLAGWVNSFPELLVGGRFDAVIDGLGLDAEDVSNRCACYAPKAWRHRAAGSMELSRIYWDSLVVSWQRIPDFATSFNEADWLAQRARNNARAGRVDKAVEQLRYAMEVDLSAFQSVFLRRRRAQTYAELGAMSLLIQDLEYLLSVPSSVTVHTLASRLTWSDVRDDPAFQALLSRYREP